MYTDQAASISNSKEKLLPTRSLANEVIQRLKCANDENQELIMEIENKLHAIVNRREPTAEGKPADQSESDFSQALFNQVGRVEIHRNRLKRILDHLNDIV